MASCTQKESAATAESQVVTEAVEPIEIATVEIAPEAKAVIDSKAAAVAPALREKFEKIHADWYEAAQNTPEIAMSSILEARTKLPQYAEMVGMGQDILPLVVEKLTHDEYFFTQLVYEALRPNDKKQLASEPSDCAQAKAKAYVTLWLSQS